MQNSHPLPDIHIRDQLTEQDVQALVRLHGQLYSLEYGWDASFETYVDGPLRQFASGCSARERIWLVEYRRQLAGSVAIVEVSDDVAQLRWLLLAPDIRGVGLGKWLLREAIEFCRQHGYQQIILWTEQRLHAAANLYQSFGFQLVE